MACLVHVTQGIAMVLAKEPILITATSMWYRFGLGNATAGMLLIGVGMLALYGTLAESTSRLHLAYHLMMIVPQQLVLFSAALAAVTAINEGRYADGVVRPVAFILADQAIYPFFACCHLFAVLNQFIYDPLITKCA